MFKLMTSFPLKPVLVDLDLDKSAARTGSRRVFKQNNYLIFFPQNLAFSEKNAAVTGSQRECPGHGGGPGRAALVHLSNTLHKFYSETI